MLNLRIFANEVKDNDSIMQQPTTFNLAQYEVINAMACLTSEEDVRSLKDVLVQFLNSRMQKELNRMWDEGLLTQEMLDEMGKEHLRTAYK